MPAEEGAPETTRKSMKGRVSSMSAWLTPRTARHGAGRKGGKAGAGGSLSSSRFTKTGGTSRPGTTSFPKNRSLNEAFHDILSDHNPVNRHVVDTSRLEVDRPGRRAVILHPEMQREHVVQALVKMSNQYASVAFRDSITHWEVETGSGTLRKWLVSAQFLNDTLKAFKTGKHPGNMASELAKLLLYYRYADQPHGVGTEPIANLVALATPRPAHKLSIVEKRRRLHGADQSPAPSPRGAHKSGAITERGTQSTRRGAITERGTKSTRRGGELLLTKRPDSVGLEAALEDSVVINADTAMEDFLPRLLKTGIYRLHLHITGRAVLRLNVANNLVTLCTELWKVMNLNAFTYRMEDREDEDSDVGPPDEDRKGKPPHIGLPPRTPGSLSAVIRKAEEDAMQIIDMIARCLRDLHHLPELLIFGHRDADKFARRKKAIDAVHVERFLANQSIINGIAIEEEETELSPEDQRHERYEAARRTIELSAMLLTRLTRIFPHMLTKQTFKEASNHVRSLSRLANLSNDQYVRVNNVPSVHGRLGAYLPPIDHVDGTDESEGFHAKEKLRQARHGDRKAYLHTPEPESKPASPHPSRTPSPRVAKAYTFTSQTLVSAHNEASGKLVAAGKLKQDHGRLEDIGEKVARTHFDVRAIDTDNIRAQSVRSERIFEKLFEHGMEQLDRLQMEEEHRKGSYKLPQV